MPKFLEEALERGAKKKGFSGKRAARYVYGAMNNRGAMYGNKETAKGAAMERKHEKDMKKGGKVARHTSKSNRGAEKPPSMGAGSAKRMISPGSNYHDGDSHGGRRGETIHLDNRGGHPGEGHKGHAKGSNEKYRNGHGQLLDEQKHWRDGIHQESGHTKRHTFHKIGHKLHADKMAHG